MTSLSAEIFAIPERGLLREGFAADLVCLDPAAVVDHATYEEPTLAPTGIDRVYQGGRLVVQDGIWQGQRAGRRLTPSPRRPDLGAAMPTPSRFSLSTAQSWWENRTALRAGLHVKDFAARRARRRRSVGVPPRRRTAHLCP